jgi:hypothetical protein
MLPTKRQARFLANIADSKIICTYRQTNSPDRRRAFMKGWATFFIDGTGSFEQLPSLVEA